jgi:hypothetical protein
VSRDRARILALLRGGGRFLITSHVNPDGDSIASQCAVRLLVERLGGRADIVNSHPVPRAYRFLPGTARFGNLVPGPYHICGLTYPSTLAPRPNDTGAGPAFLQAVYQDLAWARGLPVTCALVQMSPPTAVVPVGLTVAAAHPGGAR